MVKQKTVQLKDIASIVGVNISTVSSVLNGKTQERRISEELKDKILKVSQQLNYRPNILARSLRSGKSYIIGLILPDMANLIFSHLGRYIEEIATQEGFRIMVCSSGEDDNDPESLINSLINYHVDGIIITPTTKMKPSLFKMIEESETPYVILERSLSYVNTSQVVYNDYGIGFTATDHLLKQGLKRICIFSLPASLEHMEKRIAGYRDAMMKSHNTIKPELIKIIPYFDMKQHTHHAIDRVLALKTSIDAIIFLSNMIGLPALEYLYKTKHISIPRDLKLVSMEAAPYFSLMNPSITTINLNIKQMAEQSIQLLIRAIKYNEPLRHEQFVIPSSLIVRESSVATIKAMKTENIK
jgi:LacI family transcriptional regulator